MKTKRKLFVLFSLVILLVLIGCSSGSGGGTVVVPPPPPKVEKAPVINLTITPTGTIDYNGSFTATWDIKNFGSATLNGVAISATGSKTFSNVTENTVITIVATNIKKKATKEVTVNVGEEKAPTLTVTASIPLDSILPYYSNKVTLNYVTTDATKVTINGVEVADVNSSKVFENMIKDTTLVIIATNVNKTVTVTKTLKVGDWTTSAWGMINHSYWRNTQYYLISHDPVNGDSTHSIDFTAEDKSIQWFFNSDGSINFYYPDGTPYGGTSALWSVDSDSTHFIWGTDVYKIEEITPSSFKFSGEITWNNLPATEYYIFER